MGYGAIEHRHAKEILSAAWDTGYYFDLRHFLKESGILERVDVGSAAKNAIMLETKAWKEYTEGNEKAIGRLIGTIMKSTNGKANPTEISEILKKLKEEQLNA